MLPYIKSSESLLKFLVCEGHPIRWHSYGLAFLISMLYLFPFNVVSSLKSGSGFVLFFPETKMEHWNECLSTHAARQIVRGKTIAVVSLSLRRACNFVKTFHKLFLSLITPVTTWLQ